MGHPDFRETPEDGAMNRWPTGFTWPEQSAGSGFDLLQDGALLGVGGFFGAAWRFLLSGWINANAREFPYGTLAVNLIGSLAIAFLSEALADRVLAAGAGRLLVTGASSAHAPPFRRSATNRSSCGTKAAGRPCSPTSA